MYIKRKRENPKNVVKQNKGSLKFGKAENIGINGNKIVLGWKRLNKNFPAV